MRQIASIVILMLFLFTSCKKPVGQQERLHTIAQKNTSYFKNTTLAIDSGLLEEKSEALVAFYQKNNDSTVWTDKNDRLALQQAIKESTDDGLLTTDYKLERLQQYEAHQYITEEECMQYDLLMTQSFLKLSTHLFKGKLNPYKVYFDWALAGKKLDAAKLLSKALANHTVEQTIADCRPKHPIYKGLREGMSFINSLPDDSDLEKIKIDAPVKINDSGAVVLSVKKRLTYWQDLAPENANGTVFDKATAKAVKKFQKRHGQYPDGVVSAYTAKLLNISKEQRKMQLMANLERWRWYPYDFGKRAIVINIPTYTLAVIEDNKDTIETYKVVVGKPERRSPVLYSKLSNLVINPTWTVPPTIMKEDLTPSAEKDRKYFADHNMKIYKGRDTVETTPEEWDPALYDHYRYVQGPGTNNSLGLVKFNFSNSFSVYLHDTNHREMFKRGQRALSSGCVRVQDPMKLAGYILDCEDTGWTKEKLDEMIAAGSTESVALKKATYIHQLYWTAWKEKGGIQFRSDIYNLDKILYDKLRQ